MFTGLIEKIGRVVRLTVSGDAARLRLDLGDVAEGVALGDSVAVDGACLTAVRVQGSEVEFDVSSETLSRTTLGSLRAGVEVNVERSLRVGDRLGGHFVLGHVDCVGTIASMRKTSGQMTLEVTAPREVAASLIPKGSVAVDGISLTIAGVGEGRFTAAIIPHTLDNTTLRRKSAGDRVNIELDVLGKYVARLIGRMGGTGEGRITQEFLAEYGFT